MRVEISNERPTSVWFTAESPDDIFTLGSLSDRLAPLATKGFTLDCKISLEVPVDKLLELALQRKYEECPSCG